jgi:phage tail sheath gpL-like
MANLSIPQIPIVLRGGVYIYQDNSQAVSGLYTDSFKILMFGQKLAGGTAAANTPVQVGSPAIAAQLFGFNSQLHVMAKRIFDQGFGAGLQLWAIAQVDAGGGAAAIGSYKFGGAVTAAGTLALYVGGERVQVGITVGQSLASIATAVQAAIAGIPGPQYFAAAVDGADPTKVNLTALHKGLTYNAIDLRDSYFLGEQIPTGLTIVTVQPTGGATNPDLTNGIAAMGQVRWAKVVMPYMDTANLTLLTNEMFRRYGPMVQLEGMAHAWSNDTLSNLLTLGSNWNSPFLSIGGMQGMMAPAFALAARYAALAAVSAVADAPRQLRTLIMANELPPSPKDLFTDDANENLLQDGIATWTVGADGYVHNQRAVTTYKTNAQNILDPSYRDVETMEVLHAIRADIRGFVVSRFPNWKLADDGPGITSGQGIMTANFMKSALQTRGFLWAQNGWIEDYNGFVTALAVTRDNQDVDRLNALVKPNLINNFRTLAVDDQFIL